ncbi:DeoR/GlpR family DNA-binding transcription regulator [Aeromicrobium endophyticum]|uniref:Lactose phosphotransferase system repressor n=1 Tax=Aeromicrobium endophyticum TaxID=2292704 RepID=A0A371P0M5_9ACTN|nr:DeoR/GlpR family DNA-binding transcription regulator [Aeromicrobium endophyticum]REK68906.1 DeoR/GlpR transcriptional regulator [Aeromicrobium endophyticum]
MTPTERQRHILQMARDRGSVAVTDLSKLLDVSLETVRRDLAILDTRGLLRRSYGQAFPVETAAYESDLETREVTHLEEKRRIATEAVRHVEDAETLFIDEGFTPQLIARSLPQRRMRVVTASLPIASMLARRDLFSVYLLGGRVRGTTLGTVDHWAIDMLSNFVVDVAFIGSNAISQERGLTTPDPAVAEVKKTAVRVSRRRVFTGVSAKFAVSSFCHVADVKDLDLIITDRRLSPSTAQRYASLGPTVVRV